jgi:hypothetical protein
MFTLNNTVAALDRIALNDVLNSQTLLALRCRQSGSAGIIVEQLLFVHLMSKTQLASDIALTAAEQAEFYGAWCRAINRLSRELTESFTSEDGSLDWQRLLKAT